METKTVPNLDSWKTNTIKGEMMTDYMKKWTIDEEGQDKYFVNNGYLVYRNIFSDDFISQSQEYFFQNLNILTELSKKGKIEYDINGYAASIIEKYINTNLGIDYRENPNIIKIMQSFLGRDLAIFDQDALWINTPTNTDPVLRKGLHTDAWTGTSINTMFSKVFFTDVDEYNGMVVCPGSHLYGLVPVKNRAIDENLMNTSNIIEVNLTNIKAGDVLIWHPLLVHATAGQSDKNTRISVTSRYTSTETEFSSQERSLGYKTLSVSPMNQILRLIGSDTLQPLRTYGGFVGVDRRLEKLYGYSDYKMSKDYKEFIK